jgi:predicted nucleic acid-binding protein
MHAADRREPDLTGHLPQTRREAVPVVEASQRLEHLSLPLGQVLHAVSSSLRVVGSMRAARHRSVLDRSAAVDELGVRVPIAGSLVLRGVDRARDSDLSLWDALIVEAARAADCEVLLSEDLNADQDFGGVQVQNPFVPFDQ